jgi:hypothetical protein
MKIIKKLITFVLLEPFFVRRVFLKIVKRFRLGSYEARLTYGAVKRPHYGFCIKNAAILAKKLGYSKISVIEFGVAGGRGLLNIEYHVNQIEKLYGIEFQIYGFDTGVGLPEPQGHRDLPYIWKKGFYKMNKQNLLDKKGKAKILIGNINETIKTFIELYNPAPIGALIFDMDYYSSTYSSLNILLSKDKYFLPRVFSYFDDTIGNVESLYNDYTGQRLAIRQFNKENKDIKIAVPYYLKVKLFPQNWFNQIWIIHFFKHKKYNEYISWDPKKKSEALKIS